MARRRKGFFDDIFRRFDELFERLEEEMEEGIRGFEGEFGSGMYSITVTYDNYGRPVVKVQAQGNVDKKAIEDYLRERYPNAKIEWVGEKPKEHVRIVESSKEKTEIPVKEEEPKHRLRGTEIIEVDSKKPKIVEIPIESDEEKKREESKDKKKRGWYEIKVE